MCNPATKVALAVAISLMAYGACVIGLMRPWNPSLSHDTHVYYYPRMAQPFAPAQPNNVLSTFFVPRQTDNPDAAQAKPLFILILKAWHALYAVLDPASLPHPNNRVFSDFVSFTLVLAFGSICWLGIVLGSPWIGIVSAWCSMLTAWMLTASFFSTYTALSLCILIVTIILLIREHPRPAIAGLLIVANLFINQSITVFSVACLAFIFIVRSGSLKSRLQSAWRLAAGFSATWLALEVLVLVQGVYTGQRGLSLLQILALYLGRSIRERSEYFLVYEGGLLPYMLWQHSLVLSVLAVASLIGVGLALAIKRLSFNHHYTALVAFCLLSLLAIDLRHGPKFSRTYVLLLPFITLVSVRCVAWFVSSVSIRHPAAWILGSFLAGAFIVEQGIALARMNGAFLDVRRAILKLTDSGPVFFAAADTYFLFFNQTVEDRRIGDKLRLFTNICELGSLSRASDAYVFVGPNIKSVLNLPAWHTGETELPLPSGEHAGNVAIGRCTDRYAWKAEKVQSLSFFSHYPFLLLDDPRETFRLVKQKETGLSDYYAGKGRVTVWKVSFNREAAPSKS